MADDKNTIHTPKTFSLEIEKIAFKKRCTHLEAISIYCEQIGIEPVSTAKLLTKSLKEKVEANAIDLNYLPKSAKLPM
tara:strand:- start:469 stop:702 length:234 start_codon:yes stop_codon:yes gene_type:complete